MAQNFTLTDREAAALLRVCEREEARLMSRRTPAAGQTLGEAYEEIEVCREVRGMLSDEVEKDMAAAAYGGPHPGATTLKVEA